MIFGPMLYKYLINFPDENKYSKWLSDHRWIFMSVIILINIIFNVLIFIGSYTTEKCLDVNNRYYEICRLSTQNKLIIVISSIMTSLEYIIIVAILILIFLEWNIDIIHMDNIYFLSVISIDILCSLLLFIIEKIKINNFVYYHGIITFIYILRGISNFTLLYIIKIVFSKIKNNNEENEIINNLINQFSTEDENSNIDTINKEKRNSQNSDFSTKIINYHYQKSINNSCKPGNMSIMNSSVATEL